MLRELWVFSFLCYFSHLDHQNL